MYGDMEYFSNGVFGNRKWGLLGDFKLKMTIFAMKIPIFMRCWGEVGKKSGNYSFVLDFVGFGERIGNVMRKKDFKGRTEKRMLKKCKGVCKTYDPIQYAYADVLEQNDEIVEIRCNVVLDDCENGITTLSGYIHLF